MYVDDVEVEKVCLWMAISLVYLCDVCERQALFPPPGWLCGPVGETVLTDRSLW